MSPFAPSSAPQTILVIDDERPILGLIQSFLESRGLQCLTTTNPLEALEIIERQPIDLVISDIHMEGMTGVDVLERAKAIDPETLVILMTGQPTVETAVRSLQADAYDYLTKPFEMERFGDVVNRALEKQRLSRENAALKDTLMLFQISQAVSASVDEREVTQLVLDSVRNEVGADRVALFVSVPEGLKRWGEGVPSPFAGVEEGIAAAAATREEPMILPDGGLDDGLLEGLAVSAAAIQLRGREGLIGVLVALRRDGPRPFTPAHVQTMVILAGNAATVMESARQSRLLVESRSGLAEANTATIGALVSALDAREHETQVHSIRVTEYTLRLSREMDQSAEELMDLRFGAMLHDIGKIGIPDSILLKPGPLTEEEWVEMRRHPSIGHEILRDIGFLGGAAEIVLSHHERYDGKGYPRGLAGEEIPLGARIFAVADTFDSMTTDRPYRKAMPYEAVVEEVRRCSGGQFDPNAVEAFLRIPRLEWERISREAMEARFSWETAGPGGGFAPPRSPE
ncbi:MAG TPA: HD domain-containing phosphohydrolase [Gemmatimonadota bacterium]|nr:HD domain-containing phosphohydrolase [Gemmatimonadota bacterium]